MEVLEQADDARVRELLAADRFFWLDLDRDQLADVRRAADLLGIAPLALEDTEEFGQRPKLDRYGDTVLLVVYGVRGLAPTEVHVHLSGSWMLTVRESGCPRLDVGALSASSGEEELVARVLDGIVDSFAPALDSLETQVAELQEALLGRPTQAERRAMLEQRVALVRLRQRAAPQRDLLHVNAHLVQQLPGLDVDDDHDRLRDVHDHLVTTVQRIDAISDILASALQLHLAMVATDQAEVSRRLTGVATIFLPLSVVVGFFGMNFGWLVDHIDTWQAFVGYGLLGGAACTAGLLLYVRKLTRESTSADDG